MHYAGGLSCQPPNSRGRQFQAHGLLAGPPRDHVDADITGLRDNLGVAAARGPNEWRYRLGSSDSYLPATGGELLGIYPEIYRKTGRKNASNDDDYAKANAL